MPPAASSTRSVLLLILLGVCLAAYLGAQPPMARSANAPADQFSGMRALEHSKNAFNEPHPAGSAAIEKVRDYLVQTLKGYGLDVEVDRIPVNEGARIGVLENVMARIPGTGGADTFAMEAHYDSVAYGPGAADDGSGTVVMLETARLLKQGPPMKNDIVFIFTGDEEHGMGGARHSLKHRWLQNLNVVLAFEARGNHGPAFMFETSLGNLSLMRELATSGACPQTNSIMWEVHHRTPNGTDFGGMKNEGALGYNVAFVGGLGYYHTANDNPAHLSANSLQHQGAYAVALAHHYGNQTGRMVKDGDAVFFNTLGSHLVVYPASWSRAISLGAIILLILVLAYGMARRVLTLPGMLGGLLLLLAALIVTAAVTFPLLWLTYKLFYVYLTYNGVWYLAAFLAIALGVMAVLYGTLGRRTAPENLLAGALLLWASVLLGLEYYMQIGSYAAAWPLILASIGLAGGIALRKRVMPTAALLFETILAVPVLLLIVPSLQALYYMSPGFTVVPDAALAIAAAGLLAPALITALGPRFLRISGCAFAAALVLMGIGWATNGFTPDKPKMSSLSYALNQNVNRAIWMSSDAEPDAYATQFFKTDRKEGSINDVLPDRSDVCLRAEAPIAPLDGPRLDVTEDKKDGERRTLTLRYVSPRKVNQTKLKVLAPQRVYAASAQGFGDLHTGNGDWTLEIPVMPRTGEIQLTLTVDVATPLRVRIEEDTHAILDVTGLGFSARPPEFIPKPNTIDWWESGRKHSITSHHTVVVKEFEV